MKKSPESKRIGKTNSTKKPKAKVNPGKQNLALRFPDGEPPDPGSLWDCETVEAPRIWLERGYQRFNYKELKGIERRTLPDDTRGKVDKLLFDPSATSALMMANTDLMLMAFDLLADYFQAMAIADPEMKFALVTIIDGEDGTSLDRPTIKLGTSQSKAGKTLKSLAPEGGYFAVTESSFFNSKRHETGGRFVQPHTHAVLFTRDVSKFAKVTAKHTLRYSSNITDAEPIVIKPVASNPANLARMAAYVLKAPYKACNWCPPKDGKKGFMNHSEKGDRNIRYFRMALLRMMLTFEDCTFASGKGREIRTTLIKALRTLASTNVICNGRALHPDAIPTFVTEISKQLGKDRWALPVIERT
ncbi:hypothetical protein A9995_07645 [Erythrobacter sp. QSSC1-22B]|uniref:hypothetical protein n=1 Tax=Erythrobacter sp. QSSC1-22B TaxID=1860125 RepID=UPI000805FFEC|nr:hypothetical protein [Erythrobacter sp. QSSC1-22B]OBX19605.1 hypothetical protein A9995_07645 [Erythrobacter sp. QSSC1-22B]